MIKTDFTILSGRSAPSDYSWDQGVTMLSSRPVIPPSNSFITGYAPYVSVSFVNNSVSTFDPQENILASVLTNFYWDFNDYYNIESNSIHLTGADTVTHTYIMPGTYYISLKQTQAINTSTDIILVGSCFGDYNLNWYWDNFKQNTTSSIQNAPKRWDDLKSTSITPKTWDTNNVCLQLYGANWQWSFLRRNRGTPFTWRQTKAAGQYPKRWRYEANNVVSEARATPHKSVISAEQSLINACTVQVLEIPPKVGMYSVTTTLTGINRLQVQLTPRTTISGSFPIDRIDWDLGDGTPVKTVTRYSIPTDSSFLYNGVFYNDTYDVRNYDIIHTYYRNGLDAYPVFYPSLTCYSANTNTSDSCCLTIGPITLSSAPGDIHLINVKSDNLGNNMYTLNIDNNISFNTTVTTTTNPVNIIPNLPPSTLKNTISAAVKYTGNPGNTLIV